MIMCKDWTDISEKKCPKKNSKRPSESLEKCCSRPLFKNYKKAWLPGSKIWRNEGWHKTFGLFRFFCPLICFHGHTYNYLMAVSEALTKVYPGSLWNSPNVYTFVFSEGNCGASSQQSTKKNKQDVVVAVACRSDNPSSSLLVPMFLHFLWFYFYMFHFGLLFVFSCHLFRFGYHNYLVRFKQRSLFGFS